ncbi:hypothetical protein [Hazenella coriacea]|uniref:Competence protein CoiA-like N-terminal domain-containing protein n=1 Tax=Hazenella coriacea TaxID=1179467 RepID=A0A4R3LC41_9BACL|nr:hypothetical protein [Hazenella coriacea]TCS96815.1 hypothetical protein EDD58_101457 [Hazenella coriacea]
MRIPFGFNQRGEKVHIDHATKKDQYTCIECGQPLIVRDGLIMPKYFAHFQSQKLCPLLTFEGSSSFDNNSTGPADGIHQHFPEWMAYIRALEKGETEEAAKQLTKITPSKKCRENLWNKPSLLVRPLSVYFSQIDTVTPNSHLLF